MKVSKQFARSMHYETDGSALDLFEERHSSIFLADSFQSWLDVWDDCLGWPGPASDSWPARDVMGQPQNVQTSRRGYHGTIEPLKSWGSPYSPDTSKLRLGKIRNEYELQSFSRISTSANRYLLIRQKNSLSRLNISRLLFETLMTECSIFPRFREFLLCFGRRPSDYDFNTPSLTFYLHDGSGGLTGNDFECMYILHLAELNQRGDPEQPWSLRQFAVYHQFSADKQSSVWIYIALTARAEARLFKYLNNEQPADPVMPFEIHLLLIHSAVSNWRSYLSWLSGQASERADRIIVSAVGDDSPVPVADFTERQRLKQLDDLVLDFEVLLLDTSNTLEAFRQHQQQWFNLQHNSKDRGRGKAPTDDPIHDALVEKIREVEQIHTRTKSLRAKLAGTTELVSTLLDLTNGHSLRLLAEESRKENVTMRQLTERGFRDAIAVKCLTIITLIYLPTTTVANFFSTSFVGQVVDVDGRSAHLIVNTDWWILAVSSVVLTGFTLYIWWAWVQKQTYDRSPAWLRSTVSAYRVARTYLYGNLLRRTEVTSASEVARELDDRA